MHPRESTPYRASQTHEQFTLQSEERDAILATGKWMAIAESLKWLYVGFATKGVIALITIGLFALAFLSPLPPAFL